MKRYLPALWLTTALFLASCSTQRQATHERQTLTNEEIEHRIDSIVKARLAATIESQTQTSGEVETEWTFFDTDKPPVDSTGQPPVKAKMRQRQTQQSHTGSRAKVEAGQDTKRTEETTASAEQSTAEKEETESKPSTGNGTLKIGIGLFPAALSLLGAFIVYKRLKP